MQQLGGRAGEHHIHRPQTWTELLQQIRGELNNMPLQCRHARVHQLICRLHRPGPDPAGDTEEGHRCAIQLLSVLEHEFPESYRTNGQCEADAIWLLLRGERLAEYIDGMNVPAEERVRGGEDEHPGLAGGFQNHEGNARDAIRGRHPSHQGVEEDHPDDFEPTALIQSQLRGRSSTTTTAPPITWEVACTMTSTTTTSTVREGDAQPPNATSAARSRSPTRRGTNQTERRDPPTPNPVRRARSQASQLLESIESETQAAAEYVLNAEERGRQQRANYAAEAMESHGADH